MKTKCFNHTIVVLQRTLIKQNVFVITFNAVDGKSCYEDNRNLQKRLALRMLKTIGILAMESHIFVIGI